MTGNCSYVIMAVKIRFPVVTQCTVEMTTKKQIGVCSWSLQPDDASSLTEKVKACGLRAVQLALNHLCTGDWPLEQTRAILAEADIAIVSGMMAMTYEDYTSLESIKETGGLRPDRHWPANLKTAHRCAEVASELQLPLVTFHAGFLPHDKTDSVWLVMIERLRCVCELFADRGIEVGLETGQENAETLLAILAELDMPSVGVNFDPANVILYGMGCPKNVLALLAGYVKQIHIKDARYTKKPGTWGEEVPVGNGNVDFAALFDNLSCKRVSCDLMVERESGDTRVADVRTALVHMEPFLSTFRRDR